MNRNEEIVDIVLYEDWKKDIILSKGKKDDQKHTNINLY